MSARAIVVHPGVRRSTVLQLVDKDTIQSSVKTRAMITAMTINGAVKFMVPTSIV